MNISRKVPAFTVLEMMVAMLVSGVVITMAYSGLAMLNHQWIEYRNKMGQITECLQFKKIMDADIDKSVSVSGSDEAGLVTIMFDDSSNVKYQFGDSFLVRDNESNQDTFHFKSRLNEVGYFKTTRLITSFEISIVFQDDILPFYFSKVYSAQELLNPEPIEQDFQY